MRLSSVVVATTILALPFVASAGDVNGGTVKIEVTNLLQLWAADSTHPTVLVLRPQAEAQFFGEIRFYPSVAPAFRPTLQVTFVRRFPFGVP